MNETVRFEDGLDMFKNVVLVCKNEEGKRFVGNAVSYSTNGGKQYQTTLYKDSLPQDMDLIDGWNWLDDNSASIRLAAEPSLETGVEDILYAHGADRSWRSIDYHVADSYAEIDRYLQAHPLANGEVMAFGFPA
jgi:hypothetical protein